MEGELPADNSCYLEPRCSLHLTVNQGFLLTSINCFCDSENGRARGRLKLTVSALNIACRAACKWFLSALRNAFPTPHPLEWALGFSSCQSAPFKQPAVPAFPLPVCTCRAPRRIYAPVEIKYIFLDSRDKHRRALARQTNAGEKGAVRRRICRL